MGSNFHPPFGRKSVGRFYRSQIGKVAVQSVDRDNKARHKDLHIVVVESNSCISDFLTSQEKEKTL